MSWKSLLVMIVLVVGLLYLNSERKKELDKNIEQVDQEYVLFPEFKPQLVSEIRIDNLERAYQIKFERDANGLWFLTDPVPYPATAAIVTSLLNAIENDLAQRVTSEELSALGLEPPKVVVELEQRVGDELQSFRLDLGSPGLNKNRIFARATGPGGSTPELVSVTRAIYNGLVLFPNDFRDRGATHINPANVISFKRKGSVWNRQHQMQVDLDFEMQRDGVAWQRTDAPLMSLNPQIAGFLVSSAARLKVDSFEEDQPRDLGIYGLAEPAFSLELTTGDQVPVTLAFGSPLAGGKREVTTWFFHRLGFPHVWSIDTEKILMLTTVPEDLYNPYLVQALRDKIVKLELKLGESELLLERESVLNRDQWFMTLRSADAEERRSPAALGPVKDLLAKLEGAEVNYNEDISFEPEQELGTISLYTSEDQVFGGRLGERWKDSERGLVGYRFQRFGDELPGLLDESLAEFCQPGGIDPANFRPKTIHKIRWADARRIELTYAGKTFAYTHTSDDKRWTADPGGDRRQVDAPEVFTQSVLTLLSLVAQTWLDDLDPESLTDRLGVIVYDGRGAGLSFELGHDAEGRVVCVENGSAAILSEVQMSNYRETHKVGLIEGLIELFEDE